MDVNTQLQAVAASMRHALDLSLLEKAMNKDAQTVMTLLQDIEQISEIQSPNPEVGQNIDVRA